MKSLSALLIILVVGGIFYTISNLGHSKKNYQVGKRLGKYESPTSFKPTKAIVKEGAISENIATTTERILNKEAHFLKKGSVKTIGEDKLSAWQFVSDEGGSVHNQTAPNPLTYFAVGIASDLLTQVERQIEILGLDVDNVKVESKIFFRWSDPFSDKWAGFTDKVITNIIIDSNESPEKIKELKQKALDSWAIGESLASKTIIDSAIVISNKEYKVSFGEVKSPVSVDKGFTFTNVVPDLSLQTVEVEEDLSLDMHNLPKNFTFSEIAIAESANDIKRPYLHKIRAKSLTQNYQTWELYADDSKDYLGIDRAPSSWEYFTLGTSFCLMSQLSANQIYFQKQGVDIQDFQVEHQFKYRQNDFMKSEMKGDFGDVITRIIVKGNDAKENLEKFAKQSLRCCFAGEGIQNETQMETDIYLNGKELK